MRKRALIDPATLSMEAIGFQPTLFGKALAAQIQAIRDSGIIDEAVLESEGYVKTLEKIIEDYTNIVVKVVLGPKLFGAAYAGVKYSGHHPFMTDKDRQFFRTAKADAIIEHMAKIKEKTYVDLIKGKVYGNYRTQGIMVAINTKLVTDSNLLIPDEVASVLLHEIGHILGNCEYSSRYTTTNFILAALARSIEKDTPEQRTVVYKKIADLLDVPAKQFDGVTNSEDLGGVAPIVIDMCLSLPAQLGSGKYDYTSSEALADNYVAKCGYGRHLLTSFDKLGLGKDYHKDWGVTANHFPTLFAPLIGGTVAALTTLGVGAAVFALAYPILAVMTGGNKSYDYTYDTLKTRMKRVNEVMIEHLKDSSLPKSDKERILDDLSKAQIIINNTKDAQHQLFDRIANYLFKSNKSIQSQMDLQRDLEELSANQLFVQAAKLSML